MPRRSWGSSVGVGPDFSHGSLTIAGFLRGSIKHLPASISRREVLACHPALIPHMEIPEEEAGVVSVSTEKAQATLLVFFLDQG